MIETVETKIIARIYNSYKEKFGIPRQSGITEDVESVIVFEKEYRDENALRGIEDFSHLWIIWQFSEVKENTWSPTVRPPRLGGNKRIGVFATRSPYRPNPIGLSSVKLERLEKTEDNGIVLVVKGADLMNGTPIFDIKPYIAFSDSHPNASGGFSDDVRDYSLEVFIPDDIKKELSKEEYDTIVSILSQDPRPAYKKSSDRIYGMSFSCYQVRFKVMDGVLSVVDLDKCGD